LSVSGWPRPSTRGWNEDDGEKGIRRWQRQRLRGFEAPEPAEALAKAELARKIGTIIERRGLTQSAAAALLEVDQPKVSALTRGRLAGFSLDRLVRFLILLGSDVEIVVKPRARTAGRARVMVD
jgi:predicted XRE-type DNA-binding protein